MTMSIIFKAAAQREFDEAFDWYEKQEAGLGDRFAAQVTRALELIRAKPLLHPAIHRDIRTKRVRVYPYRIMYRIRSEKIFVLAVHHHRNDPKNWQDRT